MPNIQWGIIGCGDVTEIKSGPALQLAKGSELVAVMRRNGELAKDYAKRHRVPKWYDDADKLIQDTEVNAVYIATPPSVHKEYTIRAAKAGKPVYVEKPMAMNYGECLEMVDACEQAGVPLFVAYYRRRLPLFLKVEKLLRQGAIGTPRHLSVKLHRKTYQVDFEGKPNWRVNPAIAGCGYFCDLASHTIDILQYLLGEMNQATGYSANHTKIYQAEDIVSANFRFINGMLGTGEWIFNHYEDCDENRIIGTEGIITFPTFDPHPIKLNRDGRVQEFTYQHPRHIQQPLIQTIVDELGGNGTCPSTGRSAAQTNRVMDWILGREA